MRMNAPNETMRSRDYAAKSMEWYGFGSPVGIGILLVSIGASSLLVRLALLGI